MELNVLQPVSCPSLYKGVCLTATAELGVQVDVTPAVCNATCQQFGGPYQGRKAPNPYAWHREMMYGHRNSSNKVVSRYGGGVKAVVPAIKEQVLSALEDVHLKHSWIRSIGLTGSILFDGFGPPRDLDIVLLVTDYRSWIDNQKSLNIPNEIANLKVDVWAKAVPIRGPFAVLDLYSLALYLPNHYRLLGCDPAISVVRPTQAVPLPAPLGDKKAFPPPLPTQGSLLPKASPPCAACSRSRR